MFSSRDLTPCNGVSALFNNDNICFHFHSHLTQSQFLNSRKCCHVISHKQMVSGCFQSEAFSSWLRMNNTISLYRQLFLWQIKKWNKRENMFEKTSHVLFHYKLNRNVHKIWWQYVSLRRTKYFKADTKSFLQHFYFSATVTGNIFCSYVCMTVFISCSWTKYQKAFSHCLNFDIKVLGYMYFLVISVVCVSVWGSHTSIPVTVLKTDNFFTLFSWGNTLKLL